MRGNIIKKRLMSFTFEKIPRISLSCKLVPIQCREYENGLLLVFSVTLFKIDQNNNQKPFNSSSPESDKRKKVHIQRRLSEIQVTAIFLMQDMRRNFLPKFIEICMETPC